MTFGGECHLIQYIYRCHDPAVHTSQCHTTTQSSTSDSLMPLPMTSLDW